jgi:OTU domain-containing protein 3
LPIMYVGQGFVLDDCRANTVIDWEHYSSVRNAAGPHDGEPHVKFNAAGLSKKRPSPSVDGEHDDQASRTQKRRSPLHLFDSDSTPEPSESSSDESSGVMSSFQQSQLDLPPPEQAARAPKLTLKLRCLRTTDLTPSPAQTRSSTPAPLTPASTGTTPVPSQIPSNNPPPAPSQAPAAAKAPLSTQTATPPTSTPASEAGASTRTVTV